MNEWELRKLIRRSEKEGFRTLFQTYQAYVYTIVWNRIGAVGTREDAEEAVSDCFADVFLHFSEIREGSLHAYIGTVAKRTAIDCYRKLTLHEPEHSLDAESFPEPPDPTDIPADQEHAELRRQLLDGIESLGQPDAAILLQRFYYDRNYAEIARSLHMAAPAVRMRASRALKRLRKLLGETLDEKGGT
ncbi:MAG: sigma-70 family RNA polymerase sigma factor [Oscillospiraceae bacterium]|nr:sigma-70 family RNA polymerase sigma factor [Oscillospiraceae bacterium]